VIYFIFFRRNEHGDQGDQRQGRGRNREGRFTKSDGVGRSPGQDFRQSAGDDRRSGRGHKGDQKRKK